MRRYCARKKASDSVVQKTERRRFLKQQAHLKYSVSTVNPQMSNRSLQPNCTTVMADSLVGGSSANLANNQHFTVSDEIINWNLGENDDNADDDKNSDFDLYEPRESDDEFNFDDEVNDIDCAYGQQEPVNDVNVNALPNEQDIFKKELGEIFIRANINHSQGDILLAFLRKHPCHQGLPRTTKTLLKTPRQPFKGIKVDPGEYFHIGLEVQLMKKLRVLPQAAIPDYLVIDLHTDGMSIHRSSFTQLWPIQFRVVNILHDDATIIGVYKGQKKPANAINFFESFVNEYKTVFESGGLLFENKRIPVYIRAFIVDAPARALILNHRGHNAKYPCSKCKVAGKTVDRRMTFCEYSSEPRNNADYANQTDKLHHLPTNESALKSLNFNMVTCVPFEYMHLICLGVQKKFLSAIVDNKFELKGLSKDDIAKISLRLANLQ